MVTETDKDQDRQFDGKQEERKKRFKKREAERKGRERKRKRGVRVKMFVTEPGSVWGQYAGLYSSVWTVQ